MIVEFGEETINIGRRMAPSIGNKQVHQIRRDIVEKRIDRINILNDRAVSKRNNGIRASEEVEMIVVLWVDGSEFIETGYNEDGSGVMFGSSSHQHAAGRSNQAAISRNCSTQLVMQKARNKEITCMTTDDDLVDTGHQSKNSRIGHHKRVNSGGR